MLLGVEVRHLAQEESGVHIVDRGLLEQAAIYQPLTILGLSLAGYAAYSWLLVQFRDTVAQSLPAPRSDALLRTQTEEIAERAQQLRLTGPEVGFFVATTTKPGLYFQRISEHVEQFTRSTRTRATMTIRMPAGSSWSSATHNPVLPVFWTSREQLEDGLKIIDDQQKRVSTLPTKQVAAYLVAVIFALVEQDLSKDAQRAFWKSNGLGTRLARYVLDGALGVSATSNNERIREYGGLLLALADLGSLDSPASEMIDVLLDKYPVCIRVAQGFESISPKSSGIRIVAERRTLPIPQGQEQAFSGPADAWNYIKSLYAWSFAPLAALNRLSMPGKLRLVRRLAPLIAGSLISGSGGLFWPLVETAVFSAGRKGAFRSHTRRYRLELAGRTGSYHLTMVGPEDHYMSRQSIEVEAWSALNLDELDLHVATTPIAGQRHSHLYIADAPPERARELWYHVAYSERPPASMREATYIASASALVVGAVAKIRLDALNAESASDVLNKILLDAAKAHSAFDAMDTIPLESLNSHSAGDQVGMAQILLALPLALAAIAASRRPQDLWGGVPLARFITRLSVLLIVVAFAMATAPQFFTDLAVPYEFLWAGTVTVLLGLAAVAFLSDWSRRRAYARAVSMRHGEG